MSNGADGLVDSGDTDQPAEPHSINGPSEAIAGSPGEAWNVLSLVNDWIKHAETKAAGTIAVSGVGAGVLYKLLGGVGSPGLWIEVPAVVCGVLIAIAGLFAAWALRPRLWSRNDPTSNLYFSHIARRYPRKAGSAGYADSIRALSVANGDLVGEIAEQIWSNAHVATAKFRWASIGLSALLLGLAALAVTALAVAATSW